MQDLVIGAIRKFFASRANEASIPR
jgi:hypothetical protein